MALRCPHCGETEVRHRVARSDSPSAPLALGLSQAFFLGEYTPTVGPLAVGLVQALLFVLSRKRRFRCGPCGAVYEVHSAWTRFWWLGWFMVVLKIAGFIAILLIIAVFTLGAQWPG